MTVTTGHVGCMRVSSVELKTRLGHYLRMVECSGVAVEVCVRNHPVAFLVPHSARNPSTTDLGEGIQSILALEKSGLGVETALLRGAPPSFEPLPAGDESTDINTVEAMRAGRSW